MTFRKLATGATSSSTVTQVSPSIVIIIIVLTVIFFLSAFLHLLIRWLARNPSLIRRGLRAGTTGGSGPNNRIIALTALQGQLQQLFSIQDAGLDRSLIEGLPVFSYKAAADGLTDGADCAICLCEFVGDDQLRLLPSCGHAFHTDCIDTWLLAHSTCPLCRTLLLPECWLPGSLQPLLSSEISTVGEVEHQQSVIDTTVSMQSGRSGGALGSSSRRSSLGRVTIVAGSGGRTQVDQVQRSEPSAEFCENGYTMLNLAESGASVDSNSAAARAVSYSASLASVKIRNSIDSSKLDASLEAENCMPCATKMSSNEATSSVSVNPVISSSSAAVLSDSGHLSYTSFGNNTDVASGRFSDQFERASTYGSGRRISVHLGKCRLVNEQSRRRRKSKERGGASRRSYSKGSYEYVIDSSSNLEVLIPSQSTTPALISSSRMNDLLNLSHRLSSSFTVVDAPAPAPAAGNVPRDLGCRSLSPSWASASFSKMRFCNGGDPVRSIEEAMNAPLNTLQLSDKPTDSVRWPANILKPADLEESSTATSMRANIGSDASFSSGSTSQKLQGLNVLVKDESASKDGHELECAKRAVSFRLPTPASHHVLNAKLRASASRRALSESDEALSYWEPCLTTEESIQLGHDNDSRALIFDRKAGSHRSASFAKRTMDWLVGWRGRMVQLHPDKSVTNSG